MKAVRMYRATQLIIFCFVGLLATLLSYSLSLGAASTSTAFDLYMLALTVIRGLLVMTIVFLAALRMLDWFGYSFALAGKLLLLVVTVPLTVVAIAISEFIIDELRLASWVNGLPRMVKSLCGFIQLDIITIVVTSLLLLPVAVGVLELNGWVRQRGRS